MAFTKRVIIFPKSIFAKEEAFQLRSSTVTFSHTCLLLFVFYMCLSVCRFVKGNFCRTFAHCFVLWIFKKAFSFNPLCFFNNLYVQGKTVFSHLGYGEYRPMKWVAYIVALLRMPVCSLDRLYRRPPQWGTAD